MTKLFYFLIILIILVFLIIYRFYKNNNRIKKGNKHYSPDKRCFARIIEITNNSTDADTHVIVTFKSASGGVYRIQGIDKGLKLFWKDNATLVIETKKEYIPTKKTPLMASLNDHINIEYIEN